MRTANCVGEDNLWINIRGGYKCEMVTCPKGFVKAPSLGNRNKSVAFVCSLELILYVFDVCRYDLKPFDILVCEFKHVFVCTIRECVFVPPVMMLNGIVLLLLLKGIL